MINNLINKSNNKRYCTSGKEYYFIIHYIVEV